MDQFINVSKVLEDMKPHGPIYVRPFFPTFTFISTVDMSNILVDRLYRTRYTSGYKLRRWTKKWAYPAECFLDKIGNFPMCGKVRGRLLLE